MINEIKHIQANAQKVKATGMPNVPMLLFSSNGQETGFGENEWLEIQSNFTNQTDHVKLIELDSSHYIHNIDYEPIAEESDAFIKRLNR